MTKHLYWVILLSTGYLSAQAPLPKDTSNAPVGAWALMEVVNGDTIFNMSLRMIKIVQTRNFVDLQEQRQYNLYKYSARKVYPYALQAISLYEEIASETEGMNKRKKRRYIRREHKELKEDFTEQMKNLSKTQGKVLIKMIEKEIGKPFYEIVRETRGGMTASYWHNLGKLYGYDLKAGYQPGADALLDAVFLDYDFGDPQAWYR